MAKIARFLFKAALKTVKWVFIVLLLFVASLFFREQRIPAVWVAKFATQFAPCGMAFKCDGAGFGFRRGAAVSNARIYAVGEGNVLKPLFSAKSATFNPFLRSVEIDSLKYLRLPDSYYTPDWTERNERLEIDFPELGEFSLVLREPRILGLAPQCAEAKILVRKTGIRAEGARVTWRERGETTVVEGFARMDIPSQRFVAEAFGKAHPRHIRPLIDTLDVPIALVYMDAFTELEEPVDAKGVFDVDLSNCDFNMKLDLKPKMGRYNGVKMSHAEGTISLQSYIRGTNANVKTHIDIPSAFDAEGRKLAGTVDVVWTNGITMLEFDAATALPFSDNITIVDFLDPEVFSMFRFNTPPEIKVRGRTSIEARHKDANNMKFSAKAGQMSFLDFVLKDVEADFTFSRDRLEFRPVRAKGRTGGSVTAKCNLDMPDFEPDAMRFSAEIDYVGGSLEELSDLFHFDLGERRGTVDCTLNLDGPVSTNVFAGLCGSGKIKIAEGHLAQMRLFAGLTKLLAEKVPGVGFLVNQSDASADFTIENGVLSSDNIYIEGGLVSLKARGSYDIARDNLDFIVHVQFLKKDSIMGKIVHPVTWPFTKLLLEFRVAGPIDTPEWNYMTILDKVL